MANDDNQRPVRPPESPPDEHQIIAERRAKLSALRASGEAYPNDFRRTAVAGSLHAEHDAKSNEQIEATLTAVAVAGRMLLKRVMGKACFAMLQDMSGRIQLYVTMDGVGAEALEAFKHWDLGDIVGATGTLFIELEGSADELHDRLQSKVKVVMPLVTQFYGTREFAIEDPDAYILTFAARQG